MDEKSIINTYNEGIEAVIKLVNGLYSKIEVLTNEIQILKEDNNKQDNRLAELEARISKNSSNSSKPPSTDGFKKPKNSREKVGRATGGQIGHEGKTLEKVENPDKVVDIKLQKCTCGYDLSELKGTTKTRQVIEMPVIKVMVTEYQNHEVECPCCKKVHKTEFPQTVSQPVQYGENMQALIAYLTTYQLIPMERTTEIINDLIGQKISEGTIANVNARLYKKLEKFETSIKEHLKASDVVHFDETGLRCDGKLHWLHSASTEQLTHYAVHKKRGADADKEIAILPDFEGTAVHDHWKPYYKFENCSHAECNAHNLRNLKGAYENYEYNWAKSMTELLVEIKKRVEELKSKGHASMENAEIAQYTNLYKSILEKGKEEITSKNPKPILNKSGRPKKNSGQNLLERLEKFDIETLSFMYDFNIPFDNNLAERDIRMMKLRQKISGCFRGEDGGTKFSRIRSYVSTCRKNGQKVIESLKRAIKGDPFIPELS